MYKCYNNELFTQSEQQLHLHLKFSNVAKTYYNNFIQQYQSTNQNNVINYLDRPATINYRPGIIAHKITGLVQYRIKLFFITSLLQDKIISYKTACLLINQNHIVVGCHGLGGYAREYCICPCILLCVFEWKHRSQCWLV